VSWLLVSLPVAAVLVAAWAWFEAGWLRVRVLEVDVPGLPAALVGLRIGHLSDFHLGALFSRGNAASMRAALWVAARGPDLVCITGDLVVHPRGVERFRWIIDLLERPYVVLGNHDVAVTRDPFSREVELDALRGATLLRDESVVIDVRGVPVQIAGIDPATWMRDRAGQAWPVSDEAAAFRVLLSHFPDVMRRLPDGAFHLVLSGHLHAGQITVPLPGRRLTLAHPTARYVGGVYREQGTVMHLSSGTGTTFVPFRLFARPEVTELVLRAG
jgi:uncharacterized protein